MPGTQSIAELLVANGADITVRTGEGDSCLHRAIQARNVPTALFLIAKKVDVNAQNKSAPRKVSLRESSPRRRALCACLYRGPYLREK